MDLNNNANISALSYQFPFLNPGGFNAFSSTNLQIGLNIQILNICLCDQINTVLLSCDEVIRFENIICFGYVNIEALDYTIYIGNKFDIMPQESSDFTIYVTSINNTTLNSKIHMGIVTFEFLSLLPNISGPSHIKYTIWRGTICPAQVNKINVIKLKKHKSLVMKLEEDVLQSCLGCNVPESTNCGPTTLVYDLQNPSTGAVTYAKNFLLNYLQEFQWQMFNVNQYNAFYNQYTPFAN